jgi:hypothetical protein
VVYVAASEYVITPVRHVVYPNRVLRSAGFLGVQSDEGGELLDLKASRAWALVDHQFSHVFVRDRDARTMAHLASLFRGQAGIAEVLVGSDLEKYGIEHERSGEIVLVSSSNSWQAYYWWLDDARAPRFARTVDIHTKPGYDPVELCFDPTTKAIPLDATLIKGSHGAPAVHDGQRGVIMTSRQGAFHDGVLHDVDVFDIVLGMLGQ